jgi:diguanylate cyclase (GGDEF)-like protein
VEAGARGAQTSRAVASGAPASPARGRTSARPDVGRTQSRHRAGGADGEGLLSVPRALPRTIERLVEVIPPVVWLALLAALALAAAAAAAAILAARRGRRQARAIADAERIAATDPLTGVLNRRGFGEAIERELARARRHGPPFSLAYLDVRNLKAVNDGDGHLIGDELIKQVANLLRDCARAEDVVGRLGGDEFALLLAGQSTEGAATVANRLRAHLPVRRAAIGSDVPWDLTIGIASYPDDGESLETLLSAADSRLYAQRGIRLGRTAPVIAAPATGS